MEFTWTIDQENEFKIKKFLRRNNFSRRLISKIMYQGGRVLVNDKIMVLNYGLQAGDVLKVTMPPEGKQGNIEGIEGNIEILYEDDHIIAVNKRAGVLSLPSPHNPDSSIASHLKYYYQSKDYENQVIHIITRLDRDTSGVMLFAKHSLAHSIIADQLNEKAMYRAYLAAVPKSEGVLEEHSFIDAPIGRNDDSIITRQVREDGKQSLTEYWKIGDGLGGDLLKVQIHTGRTHQIRVHFEHLGLPLIGDDLYGGDTSQSIQRQTLHCTRIDFVHPFTKEEMTILAPLPEDMKQWIKEQNLDPEKIIGNYQPKED